MIDERTAELIHADLDGELDHRDRAELERRLARSGEARTYRERMRELCAFLDHAPVREVPDGLRAGVLDRIVLPEPRAAGSRSGFGFSRVPAMARYGLATAAGLLLAIGVYEFRPGAGGAPDFADMTGTILAGDVVLDRHSFHTEQLSSSVSLKRRDDALLLEVLLDSAAPVDITVDFTGDGLQFDAIAQWDSDLSSIEVADRAIQVQARGRQHFAVLLHRDEGLAVSAEATIRLAYYGDGILLNSGELVAK